MYNQHPPTSTRVSRLREDLHTRLGQCHTPIEPKPTSRTLPTRKLNSRLARRQLAPRAIVALGIATLSFSLTACAGNTGSKTTRTTHASPAQTQTSRPTRADIIRATLTAANHTPKINQPWHYALHATNINGQPQSGTVTIQFVFEGHVVGYDKPPTHPLADGQWHGKIIFPSQAAGVALIIQAVIHTHAGSTTLNWPIAPQQ